MLVSNKYFKRSNLTIKLERLYPGMWISYVVVLFITVLVIVSFGHMRSSGVPLLEKIGKIPMTAWMLLSKLVVNQVMGLKKVEKCIVLIHIIAVIILLGIFLRGLKIFLLDDQQLTDVDVKYLVENGEFVGYQKDSIIVHTVLKELNFTDSQLRVYNSPDEYDEALQRGSKHGGVAAIFDEIPYLELLMRKHYGKYKFVGPIYHTPGFGFGFTKGSPLVLDVSKVIWNENFELEWMWKHGHSFHQSLLFTKSYSWELFIPFLVFTLFSVALNFLLCMCRNLVDNVWKRLKGIFHIEHGESSEILELDNHNIMVSIDPEVYVKDSKQ